MTAMSNLWNREPAAIVAAFEAVLALALAFGLQLDAEQVAAIMAAVTAVLGLVVRHTVTSPATAAADEPPPYQPTEE